MWLNRFLKPEHFHLVQELFTKDKKFATRQFFNEEFFPSILNRYRRMSRASSRATIADADMARWSLFK